MKIYEAKYYICENIYKKLRTPSYDSFVFLYLDEARCFVKSCIDNWLVDNGYRASDRKKNKNVFAFHIGGNVIPIDLDLYSDDSDDEEENDECKKCKKKDLKDIEDVYCEFTVVERDNENKDAERIWYFSINGDCYKRSSKVNGGWVSTFPGDELPDAGLKFAVGDYVVKKGEVERAANSPYFQDRAEVFVVATRPGSKSGLSDEEKSLWENIYSLVTVDEKGYWKQRRLPECDMELYADEIPIGLQILQKIYTGKAPNSEKYKDLLMAEELILPDVPTYREIIQKRDDCNDRKELEKL